MPDRRRTSLLVRLLAVSVLVSVLSIAGTAWLAVRATTRAIQQEQGQALSDDAKIYDALLGYAATHRDWTGAGPLIRSLATGTDRRIAVTDRNRVRLAQSAAGALPQRASATLDPLDVDQNLATDRVDPRAVGPFALPAAERTALHRIAGDAVDCLRKPGPLDVRPEPAKVSDEPAIRPFVPPVAADAKLVDQPSGRPRIVAQAGELNGRNACSELLDRLAEPTATERRALGPLQDLANTCLGRQGMPSVRLSIDGGWTSDSARFDHAYQEAADTCLASSRRQQLAGYVAAPALLFVTAPGAPVPASSFDLSAASRARIVAVTGAVLLVTIGVTVLVGRRLVGPLRVLTAAAVRMRDGDDGARVRVTGRDEIASLGAAFNDLADHRRRTEELRRAMVGDIAHEMRTPVTNIRGWLEAADDGVVPLDRELVSSLLEEAVLLQHVIDDLQDLSAADAGELRLHPQPVDVAEVLHAVADAFAPAAERARVALAVSAVSARNMTLTADPIRLRQAVGNLVANGIRHTPEGGRVTLSARTAGKAIAIDVADTGPGIPAEQQALVFERFWRAEKSRSRQTGGSGLGLAIVRKLTEAHGGSVALTSTPGRGATFTLLLPT